MIVDDQDPDVPRGIAVIHLSTSPFVKPNPSELVLTRRPSQALRAHAERKMSMP
jgi:hypothetical protein